MSILDWIILITTLSGIMIYGLYNSKKQTAEDYLRASRQMPWYVVLLGIMATQASAITFISGPGQSYADGMRFLQYYFGLPIAMVVVAAVFVPLFQKANAYTAYDFLDKRFDRRTRLFTGILFLFSRGVSTGMSVYAPAIVLSTIFGWNIYITNILCGGLLIIYTYTGGAKAIAHTQKIQFTIILLAMAVAGYMVVALLPDQYSFSDALFIAGQGNKLNIITTDFKWDDKYNIYSGLIGGFFLSLSYFGTDQSQVGRYLSAKNSQESKLGLLMNGFVKIPMQFFILLIGALLFSFYSLQTAPLFFNEAATKKIEQQFPEAYATLNSKHTAAVNAHKENTSQLITLQNNSDHAAFEDAQKAFQSSHESVKESHDNVKEFIKSNQLRIGESADDTNYVFLHFVKKYLPAGLIGLVFAVVFLASWGSISAAINALASSTLVDFHQVIKQKEMTDADNLKWLKRYTLIWGVFSIIIAMFATQMKSLIEAVNQLGSLFYGPILGIFIVALFIKKIGGKAVFWGAIAAELVVFTCFYYDWISFLWLNVIGAFAVVICSTILQLFSSNRKLDNNF